MKSKVAIINVYFGKLPEWFQLWLESCKYNKEFEWIIFTDDKTKYEYPENVIRYICSFEDIKNIINEKLGIETQIYSPYKLCDFKTVYGKIFSEYLVGFTHWGYCDLDMIFGDLSKYITDDILENYDRIFNKGHLTIYKNNDIVNNYYKLDYSGVNYKDIFKSKYHYGFDESAGFDKLYKENNISQYICSKPIIADIDFSKYKLNILGLENYKNQYFVFENGHVYRKYLKNNRNIKEEFLYIHFQKRNMVNRVNNKDKFLIEEEKFIDEKLENIKKSSAFIKNFKMYIRYKHVFFKQSIYRFIHWKLNL
ncbi:DUF6625 family protein [Clostridium perfringens]